jgi:hypothetical protein
MKEEQIMAEDVRNANSDEELANIPPATDAGLIEFSGLIDNDFTFPMGEQFKYIKAFYSFYKLALPASIISAFIALVLIVLLSSPNFSRLRWFGITLTTAAVFSLIPLVVSFILSKTPLTTILTSLLGMDLTSNNLAQAFATLLNGLIHIFSTQALKLQLFIFGTFITGGIFSLILSKTAFVHPPKKLQKK